MRLLLIFTLSLSTICSGYSQVVTKQYDGDIGAGTSSNPDHPNPSIDTNGTYRVEVTWQNVSIYNNAGTLQSATATSTFISNVGLSCGATGGVEGRIVYERFISRWVFVIACANGDYMIVSSGSDPTTSTWKGRAISANAGDLLMRIGYDKNWIGISEYVVGSCGGNANTEIMLPAGDVAWVGAGTISIANEALSNCATYESIPETDYNPNKALTDPFYFMSRSGMAQNQVNTAITLAFDKWTPTSATAGSFSNPASPTTIATGFLYNTPVDIAEPGSPSFIRSTESHRAFKLVTNDGVHLESIWGSGPCASSCGAQGVTANQIIQWFEINIPALTLNQKAQLSDSSLGFLFPTVGVDSSGNIAIVTTGCSSTQFCSLYSFSHYQSDASNSMRGPYLITPGTANYQVCNTTPHPGWGDYADANQNVSDPTKILFIAEYANSATLCAWYTRVVELQLTNPVVPSTAILASR